MKKHNRIIFHHQGFTLVELMITIAISSLIIAAMYASYILQQRSYNIQGAVVEAQQNARVAMDFLTLDLRMAGFDPLGSSGATITAATATSIAFTADMDEDGVIGAGVTPEAFSYDLGTYNNNGVNIPTFRRSAIINPPPTLPSPQPMADYIEQVEFCYHIDNPPNPPTKKRAPDAAELPKIRAVQVTMLAQASRPDNKFTNTEVYTGAPCPDVLPLALTAGNNFRRRVITTHIDLRNMGL